MKQEDLDRIAELEDLLELEGELQEEERLELSELEFELKQEKRQAKKISAWNKAKEVYRLSFVGTDDESCYALKEQDFDHVIAFYEWPSEMYVIEKVKKPNFAVAYDEYNECYDEKEQQTST